LIYGLHLIFRTRTFLICKKTHKRFTLCYLFFFNLFLL